MESETEVKILQDIKVALVSLGCDKNLMDSEVMLGLLQDAGAIITVDEELADAVIVNTCGFVLDATDESVETIMRALSYKKNDRGMKTAVIVAGCMAQRYKEDIFEEMPEVDAIVGTSDFEDIVSIVDKAVNGSKGCYISGLSKRISEESLMKRVLSTPNYYAYMKISEGCDNHCTYCTIPSIRGKHVSRDIEALFKEAELLAGKGVKELILVAQDTAVYGTDLYGKPQLHALLKKLSSIEGIEWIRVLYCYPEYIYDELIDEMAGNEKVCKYIDMPIQHSEDNVLKRMGRKSSNKALREIIAKLRDKIPGLVIRTTLITGFPGETKQEFQALLSFVKDMRFDRLGVFAYSRESGTAADLMDGHLTENVKNRRKKIIMEEQQKISFEKCSSYIGKQMKVLVNGAVPYEKNVYFGRAYTDCPDIDGVVYINSNEPLQNGVFVNVLIDEAYEYDLIGRLV